jgi:hypothetical protein
MTASVLDGVLERFARTGPEFEAGLSNHGPMASEALVALGRADAVEPWAEEYARRLEEHPQERSRLDPGDWRAALGDARRVGDWIALFDRALAQESWRTLLDPWVARLAPGIMAAATHGVIRTAHAVRALNADETPQRLHELAEGLGYWAALYQELPWRRTPGRDLSVADALANVPRIADAQRTRFLIFDQVRVLDDEHFGGAMDLVTPGDAGPFVSEITSVFARQLIANVRTSAIAFVHSVTAPAAVRILAPHLSPDTTKTALRYTWQACAALYAAYGRFDAGAVRADYDPEPFDRGDLIDRAVATRDEHAIKFTEACLREHGLTNDAVFPIAAAAVVERLGR